MANTEIKGLDDLNKVFSELGKGKGMEVINKGIHSTGQDILVESQKNLTAGGQRVTGKLFKSGKALRDGNETQISYDADYAYYVEFGRKAGKMPPLSDITEWVVKKGLADTFSIKTKNRTKRGKAFDYKAMSIAFLIAKKIAKKGTKARPFLYPAFEKGRNNIFKNINREFQQYIDSIKA